MATLIYRLRGVAEEEAEEVRSLLAQHQLDVYETPAGLFGLSMPAIWLRDPDQLPRAKALLDSYQNERVERARSQPSPGFLQQLWMSPWRTLTTIAAALVIAALSLVPFYYLFK